MSARHLIFAASSTIAAVCWLGCLAVADGAELRASCGSRTIIRTVSASDSERATNEKESSKKVESDQEAGPDESVSGESVLVPESGEFIPAQGPTPMPVGVPGYVTAPISIIPPAWHAIDGWADFEYLLWWRRGRKFPPLVTTEPNAGVLPQATVLFGGTEVTEQARPGGRLDLGVWLDPCHRIGLGGHYVALGNSPVEFALTSQELGFFARPFDDATTAPPTPTALPVANDGAAPPTTGNLLLQSDSDVQAGDVYFRWVLRRSCRLRFDLLAGYQYSRLDEYLSIDTFTRTDLDNDLFQTREARDVFDTENEYNAGHFGFDAEYRKGCWGLETLARFGFGNMHQRVTISGSSTFTDAENNVDTRASGLLAQSATNGGVHTQDEFAFMTDTGIKLNYYVRERFKLSIGYSLMYWSNVLRPGDQVNLNVDARLLNPAPPLDATEPSFAFDTTKFYIEGLTLGMDFAF